MARLHESLREPLRAPLRRMVKEIIALLMDELERVARRAADQFSSNMHGVERPLTALVLSGILAFFAVGALTAALVLGLAKVMPAWAGALTAAMLMGAGCYALMRYARSLPLPAALQSLRQSLRPQALRPRAPTHTQQRVTAPRIPPSGL